MEKISKNLTVRRTKAQTFKVGDSARILDEKDKQVLDKGTIIEVRVGSVILKPDHRYYKESPKGLIFWAQGIDWISKRYKHFRLVKG